MREKDNKKKCPSSTGSVFICVHPSVNPHEEYSGMVRSSGHDSREETSISASFAISGRHVRPAAIVVARVFTLFPVICLS